MPTQSHWQARLVEEFAIDALALADLNEADRKKLRTATNGFTKNRSDFTRDAVLAILLELNIPSTLVTLNRYRMKHLGFAAHQQSTADTAALREEAEQRTRELPLVLGVMNGKYQLPTTEAHVDVSRKRVNLGGGLYFQYTIKHGDVELLLVDTLSRYRVPLFPGDSPVRLGEIMQECITFRNTMMRDMAAKSIPASVEELPPFKGSYADEPSEKVTGDDDPEAAAP